MTPTPTAFIRWLAVLRCRRALAREGWYVRHVRGRRVLCRMPGKRKARAIGLQVHELTRIEATERGEA